MKHKGIKKNPNNRNARLVIAEWWELDKSTRAYAITEVNLSEIMKKKPNRDAIKACLEKNHEEKEWLDLVGQRNLIQLTGDRSNRLLPNQPRRRAKRAQRKCR